MKKLYTFNLGDTVQLELIKSRLDASRIDYLVKGENMFTAAGGVPFTECYPELWIMNDADFTRARQVLEEWLAPTQDAGRPWVCTQCHESVDGPFDICWNCQSSRPE